MILVRDVHQAKYGRGDELVALFKEFYKEFREQLPEPRSVRVLTDASGPFFTIVEETVVESLAAFEQHSAKVFADPRFADWFARLASLVESGRREFWNVELEE